MEVLDFTDGRDEGAGTVRRLPCVVRTWCVLERDHGGVCVEKPQGVNEELPDWDKRTRNPSGWTDRKRHR